MAPSWLCVLEWELFLVPPLPLFSFLDQWQHILCVKLVGRDGARVREGNRGSRRQCGLCTPPPSRAPVESGQYDLPSVWPPLGCEGGGLVLSWGQGGESSHSAEDGHSEAEFEAFGLAEEKGGNARNILTQQSPPPYPLSLRGVGGGLIAENIQMVEACPSLFLSPF